MVVKLWASTLGVTSNFVKHTTDRHLLLRTCCGLVGEKSCSRGCCTAKAAMPILLTDAQRHELDTRGWFVVERVLQGAELERVSAAFDEVADRKRALDGLDDGVTGASSTTAR